MELFNVTKNRYFLAVQILINRIYSGEKMTCAQFDEQLSLLSGDTDRASLNFCGVLKNDMDIFDFSDNEQVRLRINAPVPLLPCKAEKTWLDAALSDPHCRLFFSEERIAAMRGAMDAEKMDELPVSVRRERVWGDEITEELGMKLRLILRAIHEKRKIIYSNHTAGGDLINKKATPYKVEYAIAEDKLRAAMWSIDEERPVKANLSNMFDISLCEKADGVRPIREMVQSRLLDEPLAFVVTDERSALERAIHIFSKHRRSVVAIDDMHYRFEIYYYTFEEKSLISDIMAFGPMIEVLSPQKVRDEIIRRLISGADISGE